MADAKVADDKNKNVEKAQELDEKTAQELHEKTAQELDEKIMYKARLLEKASADPYRFERAVEQFGYSVPTGDKAGMLLGMRDELQKNEKELKELFESDEFSKLADANKTSIDKNIKEVTQSYAELHKLQRAYVDTLLRGGVVAKLEQFNANQQNLIKQCNEKLDQLKKEVDAAKAAEAPAADSAAAANKDALTALAKKIDTSVTSQKSILTALPSKTEADRTAIFNKLSRHHNRSQADKYAKDFNRSAKPSDHMFSIYFDHNPDQDKEVKNNLNEDDQISSPSLVSSSASKAASKGVVEQQKRIQAEMDRMENGPPAYGYFVPFGKEEGSPFLIHRYKDDAGDWCMEAVMKGNRKIREISQSLGPGDILRNLKDRVANTFHNAFESTVDTLKSLYPFRIGSDDYTPRSNDFTDMFDSIIKLQEFSGRQTDKIVWKFKKEAFGETYVNERVDNLIRMIDRIEKLNPPRELVIDDYARKALIACTSEAKREKVRKGLVALQQKVALHKKEILQTAEAQHKQRDAEINTIIDEQNKLDKASKDNTTSDLHKEMSELKTQHGGQSLSPDQLQAIQALQDKAEAKAKAKAESGIAGGSDLDAESVQIAALVKALEESQQLLEDKIASAEKLYNHDYSDPAYEKLYDELEKLRAKQEEVLTELTNRCDRWMVLPDRTNHPDKTLGGLMSLYRDNETELVKENSELKNLRYEEREGKPRATSIEAKENSIATLEANRSKIGNFAPPEKLDVDAYKIFEGRVKGNQTKLQEMAKPAETLRETMDKLKQNIAAAKNSSARSPRGPAT
jgi:hypothetical protein